MWISFSGKHLSLRFSPIAICLVALAPVPMAMSGCSDATAVVHNTHSRGVETLNRKPALAKFPTVPTMPSRSQLSFKAGDEYRPDLISAKFTADLRESLKSYHIGPNSFGAIAITRIGQGLAAAISQNRVHNQEEATQLIVERCQLVTRRPCSLLVEGNVFVKDENNVFDIQESKIIVPQSFDPQLIPGASADTKKVVAEALKRNTALFRAVVIGLEGQVAVGSSNDSFEAAERRAHEIFETMWGQQSITYALNDDVTFDLDTYQAEKRYLEFAPARATPEKVPFIEQFVRRDLEASLSRVKAGQNHLVIALSWKGHIYLHESDTAITQDDIEIALAGCNRAIASKNFQCFVYAVDEEIVMTPQSLHQARE